jgi:diguanylate cyclase (GGDEF)-like protein
LANKALSTLNHEPFDAILIQMDALSTPLLKDLNSVVLQYQKEGEAKLSQIKNIETSIWALTLFVLLLEVIFIFQPMVHYMIKLSSKNEQTLKNLENLVELRTMHLEQSNQKLLDLASHDPLTGLRNRLNLEKDIENALEHYALHHAPFAVLMFDIDWFKKVNDTHGHDIGDLVLIEIAKILKNSVREGDHVYRAGGEEFVILLNRLSYEDTMRIAEKIRSEVAKHPFNCNGIKLKQTISGGVYHSSLTDTKNVKTLLKLVDEALYDAKESGRDQIKETIDQKNYN